jgi:hypothetical protein
LVLPLSFLLRMRLRKEDDHAATNDFKIRTAAVFPDLPTFLQVPESDKRTASSAP